MNSYSKYKQELQIPDISQLPSAVPMAARGNRPSLKGWAILKYLPSAVLSNSAWLQKGLWTSIHVSDRLPNGPPLLPNPLLRRLAAWKRWRVEAVGP